MSGTTKLLGADEAVEETTKGTIDTNVILTKFETSMLDKLSLTDEEGVVKNTFTKEDIYGMVIHTKADEEGVIIRNKFLSLKGRYKNGAGIFLNATVIVTDDSRFYMSLGNQEIKKATGKDLFVNHLGHMQAIIAGMQGGFMDDEQISEEAQAINTFGS